MFNHKIETLQCPFCYSSQIKTMAQVRLSPVRMTTHLQKCRSCCMTFAFPKPSEKEEKEYYASVHHLLEDEGQWRDNRLNFFSYGLIAIERKVSRGKLLDIGCGAGYFLEMAQQNGWNVTGIELSMQAVLEARERRKLHVIQRDFEDLDMSEQKFEAVTMWNVLDQIQNPKATVEKIYQMLSPNGVLALRITNLAFHWPIFCFWRSIQQLGFYRNTQTRPVVFHTTMFEASTIKQLLQSVGFLEIEIKNSPLDPQPRALQKLVGDFFATLIASTYTLMTQTLFYLSFRQLILGPSLFVIARKVK